MANYRHCFGIMEMARNLQVSPSGYYAWFRRGPSRRARENDRLKVLLKSIHQISRKTYGVQRLSAQLRSIGEPSNLKRVYRLMKELGIRAKQKRRYRATTDSKHKLPVAPNILDRQFNPTGPDQVWASDLTYVWTEEGWLYLTVVMDLFSRRVIGWSIEDNMRAESVIKALDMAIKARNLQPDIGLVHHSDRGVQYASGCYQGRLSAYKILCSMSRKGNCWDNAVPESFFHTIKTELTSFERFQTRRHARQTMFEWIEVFYNRQRLHSTLGYLSPVQFERLHMRGVAA